MTNLAPKWIEALRTRKRYQDSRYPRLLPFVERTTLIKPDSFNTTRAVANVKICIIDYIPLIINAFVHMEDRTCICKGYARKAIVPMPTGSSVISYTFQNRVSIEHAHTHIPRIAGLGFRLTRLGISSLPRFLPWHVITSVDIYMDNSTCCYCSGWWWWWLVSLLTCYLSFGCTKYSRCIPRKKYTNEN